MGGRELNYSSDVDLLYPLRSRDPAAASRARSRTRRRCGSASGSIELLQKRTEDGYAFRVDLRLRPSPEVTPIALPVEAAISYYESSALPWERAAFIRARAGGRRSRRWAAISSTPSTRSSGGARSISARSARSRSITRRIRDHYAQGQAFGPGYDLKRGRGGIREIEFFAQIHQLIHGGREPELRAPATLDALAALAEAGRIDADDAAALADAYRLLRTIEHRLQMVDDRQTHSLPADPRRARQCRAAARPRRTATRCSTCCAPHVERVGALYDTLGAGEERRLPADPAALEQALAAAGFADPAPARARIEGWRGGKARSLRTDAGARGVRGDAAGADRRLRPPRPIRCGR